MPQTLPKPEQGSKKEIPKSDEEFLSHIESLYADQTRQKYPYERQWYINIAHYLGFQYATWNEFSKRLEEPRVPSYRVRLVANHIISTVQLALAKLTKTKPILMTVPATTEEEDRNASRTGDKVLEAIWRKLDCDVRLQDVLLWATLASASFWKIYWNAKAGPRMKVMLDMDGEPILDDQENTTPMVAEDGFSPVYKDFNLGEVAIEIVSPFEIHVDPQARSGSKPRWILHSKVRDLSYIRQHYPERGKDVVAETDLSASTFFEQKILSLVSTFTSSSTQEHAEDQAVVKEFWHEPSDDYLRGKLVTVANGIVLQNTDLPNEYLEPDSSLDFGPFVKFIDIPVPGRYWPVSLVENLIPLQKNLNKNKSQVVEARNLMSKPKWLVPRGANVHQSAITSEPGEIIEYTPMLNHKPEAWVPPPIPSYVFEEQQQMVKDIQEVSGIRQVSRGEAPQGVRAGIAIRFLQEMDDTQIGPKIRRLETALARAGTLILRIVQEHYKEKRTLQVVGANRQIEVFDFIGADLRNNTDVVVQAGSGFPELKSAKQQYLLDLYQQGLFGNPQDSQVRSKILRLLELGDVDTAFEDERQDERWAQQENRLMAEGYYVEPQYFEDHIAHKKVLNSFMKTDKFRQLSPEKKKLFVQHDLMHAQLLAPEPPLSAQPETGEPVGEAAPAVGKPPAVNGSQANLNGGGF